MVRCQGVGSVRLASFDRNNGMGIRSQRVSCDTRLMSDSTENPFGSHRSKRVYERRETGSRRLQFVLLRIGQGKTCAWVMEASCVAQGTTNHVKVPLERFLSTKVEDGRTEECLRSVE